MTSACCTEELSARMLSVICAEVAGAACTRGQGCTAFGIQDELSSSHQTTGDVAIFNLTELAALPRPWAQMPLSKEDLPLSVDCWYVVPSPSPPEGVAHSMYVHK